LGGYVRLANDPLTIAQGKALQNKSIAQRISIYTAGPLLNLLLATAGFIIIGYRSETQVAGIVGAVDAGSPAWTTGARSGDILWRIGDVDDPAFDDLRATVPLSGGSTLDFSFGPPEGPRIETTIKPRRNPDESMPVIGIQPAVELALPKSKHVDRQAPVWLNTAAARAKPPFQFGDEIIATTDPDDPSKVTELPANQHNLLSKSRDFFAFRERLARLAGKEMVIRVLRKDANGQDQPVDIHVPPAYHYSLGLRMKIGRVVAVRHMKDAPLSPVQPGDRILAVEVQEPGGGKTRWVIDRTRQPAEQVVEKDLDPVRLPFELKQWAHRAGGDRRVKLEVQREEEKSSITVFLAWDDRFRYAVEPPLSFSSPMSIPELGIAYQIETTVEECVPNSPAARAKTKTGQDFKFEKGDVITEVRFFQADPTDGSVGDSTKRPANLERRPDAWAHIATRLQEDFIEAKQLSLTVERQAGTSSLMFEDIVIVAEEDKEWPRVDRGLVMANFETRVKRAGSLGEAFILGMYRTYRSLVTMFNVLAALIWGSIAPETMGGPVRTIVTATIIPEFFLYQFLMIFCAFSVVLVAANLFPLPGCDGGSIVRILYDRLRKPGL
jgi:regulator of sigma E protease